MEIDKYMILNCDNPYYVGNKSRKMKKKKTIFEEIAIENFGSTKVEMQIMYRKKSNYAI